MAHLLPGSSRLENLYIVLNVGLNIHGVPANCIHLLSIMQKIKGANAAEAAHLFVGGLWLFSDLQWGKLVPTTANINEPENVFALMSQIITAKNFIICSNLRTVTR